MLDGAIRVVGNDLGASNKEEITSDLAGFCGEQISQRLTWEILAK